MNLERSTMSRYPLLRFNLNYFLLAMVLLGVEIIIALFFHDRIIRPYVGDLLVVILIYCFWKSFFNTPTKSTAVCVFLFACFIEWLQYINFIELLGWQHSALARTLIGYSFEWIDIAAYLAGTVLILVTEDRFKGLKV